MKYKLSAVAVLLPLVAACGGGGGDDGVAVDPDRGGAPTSGTFSTTTVGIMDNGANNLEDFPNEGPQAVNDAREISWPGLRFGDFLLTNNPWNASAASYEDWYQSISLANGSGGKVTPVIDWDWGAASDTNGSQFNTKSYPELIYGIKSQGEVSGDFAATGLPVENYNSPVWTIDYGFTYEGRRSGSPTDGGTDSEFNIAIESFYHTSCDIQRTGQETDNTIFELMVWLHHGDRLPSGQASTHTFTTSDGRLYDVYAKNSNFNYVAYVAREKNNSGRVYYSEILRDAQDNAETYGIYPLKSTDCLANILMGTEIWHGAGTFSLTDYQINRTY